MPPRVSSALLRGNDRDPSNRMVRFTATVDMLDLPTLPDRMMNTFHKALVFHLHDAARRVISTARGYLVRLEEPAVKVNWEGKAIHGYDTGLLYITLISELVHELGDGVFYDIGTDEAPYWRFVEFGFHTRSGAWWPGYHFLEQAIRDNEGYIRQRVREAWHDTATLLAREAQAPGFTGKVIGLTR